MNDLWDRYEDANLTESLVRASVLARPRKLRLLDALERSLEHFSPSERLALYVLSVILGISALTLIGFISSRASVTLPARGGSLVEGEVGPLRFINPLLAISQADQDLSALVYSGLMRRRPDGSLVPDLAESYSISQDGTAYTFKLRPGLKFQDGSPVTSADIVFTVQEALDPGIKSPHRADWTGVGVSAPDAATVVFTLPHAYAPFLADTTIGILPKHLWQRLSPEEILFSPLNMRPVGSGPYQVTGVSTDATGAASRYDLSSFGGYALGAPYLSRISFVFYPDTVSLIKDLNAGNIDAAGALSPQALQGIRRSDLSLVEAPLPRVFGVFFNQSHNPVLADLGVRHALDVAVDKEAIVENVLSGRGGVLSGPIPPGILGGAAPATPGPLALTPLAGATSSSDELMAGAKAILAADGWRYQLDATTTTVVDASSSPGTWVKNKRILAFSLATGDQPELVATARALASLWRRLGVQVSVQIYPLSDLGAAVLRPRAYDALLFGEDVGPELDLYAFWHSSQSNDPGLNLALYANPAVNSLLSNARAASDEAARDRLYSQFAGIVSGGYPAVFLYAPDFLYVVPRNVRGISLGSLGIPADRFENVYEWYADTERVWNIFAPRSSR